MAQLAANVRFMRKCLARKAAEKLMTNDDSTDKLVPALVAMMSDGFNRSLAAIESVGAIDSTRLREDYKPGSRFYEIVTSQLYETAIAAQQTVRNAVD